MQSSAQGILEAIRRRLDAGDMAGLAQHLHTLHPADIAEVLGRLEPEEREWVLGALDRHHEAEVIEYVEEAVRSEILSSLDDREVSEIAEEMPPEEAADLLSEIPEERAEHVLELMAPPEAEEVEELLRYPPETAGGRMSPALVRVRDDVSVGDLLEQIRSSDEMGEEDIYYIYVVDGSERVLGVMSLWTLLRTTHDTSVRELMTTVDTIPADMDQEKVAAHFQKYDIAAAPVVDKDGRLLGRVTFDDIQDVVEEEMTEDMSKFAGTDDEELASLSSVTTARLRLPWLLICLAGTFVSGSVIHHFGVTLQANIILVVFVPTVMATAGNSGLQTAMMTIRGLATGYVERVGSVPLLLKQFKATILVAVACGVLAGAVGGVWSVFSPEHFGSGDAALLGAIIGGSMFAAICVSATLGVVVPMTFRRIGIDPAVASGPLITTSSDIFSLVVYLGVATALLVRFGT